MKIKIIIEKDETGYYTAEVPLMPGCLSQGKTIEEVKFNIVEAINAWIEVMNQNIQITDAIEIYEVAI